MPPPACQSGESARPNALRANTLNLKDLVFPITTKQIPTFERNNENISVNVLYYDRNSGGFIIEYPSTERGREHHINLLLLDDENDPSKRHYTWINNMSALVWHRTKAKWTQHVCNSCLHAFPKQETLDDHVPYCNRNAPQQVIYPTADKCTLMFRARQKQHPVPFFLVCDFESFLIPVETGEKTGGLSLVDEHQVSGFCCYRVTDFDEYETPPYVYICPNPMTKFYDHMMSESREICHIVTGAASMLPLTEKQAAEYARAVSCSNCGKAFSKDNHKTHHHCHISGKYLFPACNRCNLN